MNHWITRVEERSIPNQPPMYIAHCSCGWQSSPDVSEGAARSQGQTHVHANQS
jgi:hypothetical protein